MSSIIAAPRMMRLVSSSNRPICPSTRAVIPSDVATIAVAINKDSTVVAPHACINKYPPIKGTTIPRIATIPAFLPTLKIADGFVSSPTLNREQEDSG